MERIKEALEKANVQRDSSKEGAAPEGAQARPSVTPGVDSITYTDTKSVSLDPKTLEQNRVLTDVSDEKVVNAYKILRTQILHRLKENNWNALAVTSVGDKEGKTLTAVNLAISIANEVNHTVLLVDFNMRDPSVHKVLGIEPKYGIGDQINSDLSLSEIMINPSIDRLVVLPGREPVPNSSEVLSSPKLVAMVDEMKSRYPNRIVIFDLPPLLSADDALAFSPYVDAALLVIGDGKTQKDDLKHAVGYLRTTKLLGTVLNSAA